MMSAPEHRLLLVEDDADIRDLLSSFLGARGFRLSLAASGGEMDRILARQPVDLLILDIMLPGESGLDLCRRVRGRSSLPIIMLTALGDDTDRIIGLEIGADDYLPKPFNPHELLARLRAVLRRAGGGGTSGAGSGGAGSGGAAGRRSGGCLEFQGWRLDLGRRQLHAPDGARVHLTSMEFDLLAAFCQHPRQTLSREMLMDLTHGQSAQSRSIDLQVSRLRKKIETDPHTPGMIRTVRSGGYIFIPEVAVS